MSRSTQTGDSAPRSAWTTITLRPCTPAPSEGGIFRRDKISYHRFGLHSAYVNTTKPEGVEEIAQACRDGTYYPRRYTILQFVPNVLMAFFRTDFDNFHCIVQLYEPVRHDRTNVRAWLYPAPVPGRRSWARKLSDSVRSPIIKRYVAMVVREDNLVCERIQKVAHQIGRPPLLGRLEERSAGSKIPTASSWPPGKTTSEAPPRTDWTCSRPTRELALGHRHWTARILARS